MIKRTIILSVLFATSLHAFAQTDATKVQDQTQQLKALRDAARKLENTERIFDLNTRRFQDGLDYYRISERDQIPVKANVDFSKVGKGKKMYAVLADQQGKVLATSELTPLKPTHDPLAVRTAEVQGDKDPTIEDLIKLLRDLPGKDARTESRVKALAIQDVLDDIAGGISADTIGGTYATVSPRAKALAALEAIESKVVAAELPEDQEETFRAALRAVRKQIRAAKKKDDKAPEKAAGAVQKEVTVKAEPDQTNEKGVVVIVKEDKGKEIDQMKLSLEIDSNAETAFSPNADGGRWKDDRIIGFVIGDEKTPPTKIDAGDPTFTARLWRAGAAGQFSFGVGFFGVSNPQVAPTLNKAVDSLGNPITIGGQQAYERSVPKTKSDFSTGLTGFLGFTYLLSDRGNIRIPDYLGWGRGGPMVGYDFSDTPNRIFLGWIQYLTRDEKMSMFLGTQMIKTKRFTGPKVGKYYLTTDSQDSWDHFAGFVWGISVPLDKGKS